MDLKDFSFEQKLQSCVACGSTDIAHKYFSPDTDWSIPGFNLDQCGSCDTTFVNPRPDSASIVTFYNSINERFPNHTNTSITYYTNLNRRQQFIQDYLAPMLVRKGGGSHFDFGAGAGWLMRLMQDVGFQTDGVDLVADNVKAGNTELGLAGLRYGDLNEIPDKTYDIFTAFSTIEHLTDPLMFARTAYARTKHDGIVALVFPDLDSIMSQKMGRSYYWVMSPYHLTLFTRRGIELMLRRAGFRRFQYSPIQRSWKWTYALAHKMDTLKNYYRWREDPEFVKFDIALDNLFDEIARDAGRSSNMMILCQK